MKKFSLFAAVLGIALSACKTVQTTNPGVVGVEREQRVLSFVSEKQLQESAAQAYAQQLQQARSKGTLNKDSVLVARVRTVANRIIRETRHFRQDAPNWPWEINVESSPQLNAYVMPGGKIMVYTGLIEKLDLNDAELSAVIGHEIAHALREHTRERVSRAYGQELAVAIGAAALGLESGTAQLANAVGQVTFQLPHSREQEAESDRIGMELMARSGYDPNAAVSVWRKMSSANPGGPPEMLSTHPSTESRIRDLEALVPRVAPLYQAAPYKR
ncbi:MAG TPA: M48 family metallopeptidase [Burkholderiales bacterium]|nr:M48 family metallopeptidase [Burkholderiales bacterium]